MIVNLQDNKNNIKIPVNKKCDFCNKLYDGLKLFDNINNHSNEIYLTCVYNNLRIWKNNSYLGCYEINYCPICGKKLNNQ